jgi:(4S)-4-hydroxy-5-phosphonooxypentane-2,3-dione isomerase
MPKIALWVELDVKPLMLEAFLAVARGDARGSVTTEPGCRRFDILRDAERPSHVCFYEVYDDEAALLAHRDTPHFKRYVAESETMIAARKVTRLAAEVGGAP